MPELPEVETVRRGLQQHVAGRRIVRVEVGRERVVRRTSREALIHGLTDVVVLSADRRGKYLLLPLDSGDSTMIHLRMSGQVLLAAGDAPRPAHTHVALTLDDRRELWFVDPRTFGEVVVFDPSNLAAELPELAKLGIDPVTDGLSRAELTALLRRDRQLKALLLDQHVVAGIGNIYCDEALHLARLRPDRIASSLTTREIGRLHRAIHETLAQAIEAGGSTLADTQYVDLEGQGGWFQLHHRVYDRAGERCLTCHRATIQRAVVAGRSTCWCPRCQH
jgi:formamidopyrimidine-DNA glycosylase